VRVEHHLLALAQVGAHIQHAAVAQADLRYPHGDRASDEDVLVAPVELVGLARGEGERHVGFGRGSTLSRRPSARMTADVVVAAAVAQQAQLLEHPLEGQALPLRPLRVGAEHRLELADVRPEPWQRLILANIAPLGRLLPLARPHDAAHRIARQLQLSRDRLDLASLHEVGAPYPADRVHRDHPPLAPCRRTHEETSATTRGWGQNCAPITPKQGSNLHAAAQVRPRHPKGLAW